MSTDFYLSIENVTNIEEIKETWWLPCFPCDDFTASTYFFSNLITICFSYMEIYVSDTSWYIYTFLYHILPYVYVVNYWILLVFY